MAFLFSGTLFFNTFGHLTLPGCCFGLFFGNISGDLCLSDFKLLLELFFLAFKLLCQCVRLPGKVFKPLSGNTKSILFLLGRENERNKGHEGCVRESLPGYLFIVTLNLGALVAQALDSILCGLLPFGSGFRVFIVIALCLVLLFGGFR